MSFFAELKRRNVVKVGIAYIVASWLILQLAEVLTELIGLDTDMGKIVIVLLAVGFIPALIFAWAFEMTPEGVKRERDVDRSQSITPQTGKKLTNTILVLMAVAIAYLLFDKFSVEGPDPLPTPATGVAENSLSGEPDPALDIKAEAGPVISRQSIAVLPFDNRSNREEDQFFTDGIHDDLLTTIARIGSMKVISRTSVMEYKGTTKKIPVIAKELGVANVLEGGIQRSGDQVRINVQLIDAETDEHLWAQIFDRKLTAENLFAIQSEISEAIAEALKATLSPEEKHRINTMPTDNLAAYDAYLRGRQLVATRDSEQLQLATEEFKKAVELDPQFALAWVGVADSYNLLSIYGTLDSNISMPVRENAINKALALDENLGEVYASLGSFHNQNSRMSQAESAFSRAIELSPNYATAYHWYSNFLKNYPLRIDETIKLAKMAADLDPRSSVIGTNLGGAYHIRGLYSIAERQYKKVIELDPDFAQGYDALAGLYTYQLSRYPQALDYALKVHELDPGNISDQGTLVDLYLELGDMESVNMVRERMVDLDANHESVGYVDTIINISNGNMGGAREAIDWMLPKIKNFKGYVQYMGVLSLIQGDIHRSREIILGAFPGWLEPDQWQNMISEHTLNACVVSWILINTGNETLGADLLQQATTYLDEALPAAIEHADNFVPELCYLTSGNVDKALQMVETQLAHNHLFGWKIYHQLPMYDLIRHEPRYQAAFAEREHRIALQREAIEKKNLETGP